MGHVMGRLAHAMIGLELSSHTTPSAYFGPTRDVTGVTVANAVCIDVSSLDMPSHQVACGKGAVGGGRD
jgi:hypothetical protein